MTYDVVVPTLGRPSLRRLLEALARAVGPHPGRVIVVHDGPPEVELPDVPGFSYERLMGRRRGPAAARNLGWRASDAHWIAFLDDDVVPSPRWPERLELDLRDLPTDVVGSQGRIDVPRPRDRRPTDWERNVAGLERALWATADMAYRRDALARLGGFDERFGRAYREDTDLALRAERAGFRLARGSRSVTHPVPPADRWVSVRLQAGNADDALLRALHGDRRGQGEPRGRRGRHLAVAGAGVAGVAALALGRRRAGALGLLAWLAGTAELAWARIAPGPRTAGEVGTMAATSVALPFAASYHWLRGLLRARRLLRAQGRPAAVLLDRDGTLVEDVPYNGDPARVRLLPGVRDALDRLRAAGIPIGVVSNQSGVGRGLLTEEQVAEVNSRVEELAGPVGHWAVCLHRPEDACSCRKPRAGLVVEAAAALGVDPGSCAVVGDIGADVAAALAAGARPILVPNGRTLPEERRWAPEVAPSLGAAVDRLLEGGR